MGLIDYEGITFEDAPSTNTPLSAENLNKLNKGISDINEKAVGSENPVFTESMTVGVRDAGYVVGTLSTSFGMGNVASANCSHVEGMGCKALGMYSHSEGCCAVANREGAHAEGNHTTADGEYSHAEGLGTIANVLQHVQGKYNVEDTAGTYVHIVGGGTSSNRKNIHTLDWLGNAVFAGDVTNGNGVSLDGLKALIDELQTKIEALTTT